MFRVFFATLGARTGSTLSVCIVHVSEGRHEGWCASRRQSSIGCRLWISSMAGSTFDQLDLAPQKGRSLLGVGRHHTLSGAEFGHGSDFRGTVAIRPTASGPRESAPQPKKRRLNHPFRAQVRMIERRAGHGPHPSSTFDGELPRHARNRAKFETGSGNSRLCWCFTRRPPHTGDSVVD